MSILARIRANGGDVIRDEWRFSLKPGRLKPDAIAWIKAHWIEVCVEAWPAFGAFEERAAIREFDGGQARADAERSAYDEVTAC
ncbi:hypothetical protein ACUSIJ_24860 [Pseudochelatococcus sp. B33]